MTGALGRFQDDFILAIHGEEFNDQAVAALTTQPGFAVYRNTIFKGYIDAIQANYPCIERLVGTEWFRAAAAVYVTKSRPVDSRLLEYGEDFPEFLEAFEPAKGLPYLPDVARLDRLWTESHTAADAQCLTAETLAQIPTHELEDATFKPHPAARWRWFPSVPAYTIWRANREQFAMPDELDWTGEGALLTRPDGGVQWQALSAAACAFLDACEQGLSLERAVGRALEVDTDTPVEMMLGGLLQAGALCVERSTHPLK